LALTKSQPAGLNLSQIIARTGWMESAIRETATVLVRDKQLRIVSEDPFHIMASSFYEQFVASMVRQLDSLHSGNPLAPGFPREALRAALAPMARQEIFRFALDELSAQRQVSLSGDLVARASHAVSLLPDEQRARDLIAGEFERAGLAAPSLAETLAGLPIEKDRAQKIVQLLLRENVLVKITGDLLLHRAALAWLRELLSTHRRDRGDRISVPQFKDLAGVSRKYAIPLLEYLDRHGLTRRAGNDRVILTSKSDLH
jgi:selenocysteine-specific elongation factor